MTRKKDPLRPNLRQVHLLQTELLDEVNSKGFQLFSGNLGENISTREIDLPGLPTGTRLHVGDEAVIEITGLRFPCVYIERFQPDLLALMSEKQLDETVAHKAGVMGIVIRGGVIYPDDPIGVQLPEGTHMPLQPV
jgi:MOSC domain-containing protein YiiM